MTNTTTVKKPRKKATKRKVQNNLRIKNVVPRILENNGNVSKSMREVGYTESYAKNPHLLTNTIAFQEEARSVVERLEGLRNKFILALERKNIDNEATFTLSATLKGLTHDIQLLSGGKTENVGLEEQRETLRAVLLDLRSE